MEQATIVITDNDHADINDEIAVFKQAGLN